MYITQVSIRETDVTLDSRHNPGAQYKLATHLVTMDIATFTQMADLLPQHDVKVPLGITKRLREIRKKDEEYY
jgi:hypothetical protein